MTDIDYERLRHQVELGEPEPLVLMERSTVIALLDALAAQREDFAAMKVEAQTWKEQAEGWAVRSAAQQKVVEAAKNGHHRHSLLRPPGSCFCRTANCPILVALDALKAKEAT